MYKVQAHVGALGPEAFLNLEILSKATTALKTNIFKNNYKHILSPNHEIKHLKLHIQYILKF